MTKEVHTLIHLSPNENRSVFIRNMEIKRNGRRKRKNKRFLFDLSFQRYQITVSKNLEEFYYFERILRRIYPNAMTNIIEIPRRGCRDIKVEKMINILFIFMQTLVDDNDLFITNEVKTFLNLNETTFSPEYGTNGMHSRTAILALL